MITMAVTITVFVKLFHSAAAQAARAVNQEEMATQVLTEADTEERKPQLRCPCPSFWVRPLLLMKLR